MTQLIQVRGTARFPWLNTPDTKFDEAGVFKTDLLLDSETAAPLLARFEAMRDAAMAEWQAEKKGKRAKAADLPLFPELDEDGNETGSYILRVKAKASGITKAGKPWRRQLPLFDSVGNPTNAKVGGGSEIVVSVEPRAWANPKGECSVTMRLEAVQILRLSEGGSRSAGAYGFDKHDGYVASDDDEAPTRAAAAIAAVASDEGDYDL